VHSRHNDLTLISFAPHGSSCAAAEALSGFAGAATGPSGTFPDNAGRAFEVTVVFQDLFSGAFFSGIFVISTILTFLFP
jgi:hypothetical protein